MTTCTATTAVGHSCKNHAIKGAHVCEARAGTGIVNPGEYDKTGTHFHPMGRQPAQAEASPAQRSDLLRQFVPTTTKNTIPIGTEPLHNDRLI